MKLCAVQGGACLARSRCCLPGLGSKFLALKGSPRLPHAVTPDKLTPNFANMKFGASQDSNATPSRTLLTATRKQPPETSACMLLTMAVMH